MSINLQKLEEELDKKYKENGLLSKIAQRYSPKVIAAGLFIAAVSAPFIGIFCSSAKRDYEQRVKQEARQEALHYKENYGQELNKQKAMLDAEWKQIEERKEELRQKENDLDYMAMEVGSAARIAEFDRKYLKIKEDLIQAKQDLFTKKLNKREQALQEAEQKLERMIFNHLKESLPFYK